jgi:hypothetical protein
LRGIKCKAPKTKDNAQKEQCKTSRLTKSILTRGAD